MARIKKGLLLVSVSKVNSRYLVNVSKLTRVWLGDLYKQRKLHLSHQRLNKIECHQNWISSTFNSCELS